MSEQILSAGIDIGTSTTQVVFSKLTIENTGGFGSVPKIEITDKKIIYAGKIHFTPLLSENEIDIKNVCGIISEEYELAGLNPCDIATGAVIITGETSRKRNASETVQLISETAGDFVVAAAGPDLESVLAGKGSGAAKLSADTGKLTANFDIGGGTTNICLFKDGEVFDTACLDIGGRLIKLDKDNVITYISPKLAQLTDNIVSVGEKLTYEKAEKICTEMVSVLAQAAGIQPADERLELMTTNHTLQKGVYPELITFSGGVADCIYNDKEPFLYGDIGTVLGRMISASELMKRSAQNTGETIRATVVGAGNFSMEVSGSTIEYRGCKLPIKNIPCARIKFDSSADIPRLKTAVRSALTQFDNPYTAVSFAAPACPSFADIEAAAEALTSAANEVITNDKPLIIISEADIGKALGQALKRRTKRSFICIDKISCGGGDFVCIGEPLASGKVLPVIVKTLIFDK
ncbi:MAG: ethanolamine ammonia-lyase reactivating factor EutA [Oscillospiraceae bacterium]